MARVVLDVISYNVRIIDIPDEVNLGKGQLDITIEQIDICKDPDSNIYLIPKIHTHQFAEDMENGLIDRWKSFLYDGEKSIIYKEVHD